MRTIVIVIVVAVVVVVFFHFIFYCNGVVFFCIWPFNNVDLSTHESKQTNKRIYEDGERENANNRLLCQSTVNTQSHATLKWAANQLRIGFVYVCIKVVTRLLTFTSYFKGSQSQCVSIKTGAITQNVYVYSICVSS